MLKTGDKVKMNNKYYVSNVNKDKLFAVSTRPREVHGELLVWLDEFCGYYPVDGLVKVNADGTPKSWDSEEE